MQHDPQRLWGCERCPRSHIRLGEVSEPVVRLLASRPRNGTEGCSKHKPAGFLVHVGGVHARELSGEVNGGRAGAFLPGFLSCLRELAQGQTPAIRSLQSPLGAPPAPWDTPPPAPTRTSRASVSVGLVLHQPHGQQEPGSRAEVAGEEGSLTQSGRRGSHEC